MNRIILIATGILVTILVSTACKDDDVPCNNCTQDDLINANYAPQPYQVQVPSHFLPPESPADNSLTVAGIALGRSLFYDKILSDDNSMACASCHLQSKAFTDGLATSKGILGLNGIRSSMALVNMAYNNRGFFWDGRSLTLEDQALLPVEDHLELNTSWDKVEQKLRNHAEYPVKFREAFGIEYKSQITRELAIKAIAQFERTLVSANSRYDQVVWANQGEFTPQEERGFELFFIEFAQNIDHPGCSHCHFAPHFTDNQFRNNGLDNVSSLNDFVDKGRGAVTNLSYDNGKFRVPTLRNIALTAPYMHDGRFETLEQVIDHYSQGGHGVENEDTNIRPFNISAEDKAAIIAFLHTLTDSSFISNPAFSSPF